MTLENSIVSMKKFIRQFFRFPDITKLQWKLYAKAPVTIYTTKPDNFQNHKFVVNTRSVTHKHLFSISLISTVYNEADNIRTWLASIEKQTIKPDEVVIVDGGSNDGTPSKIEEYAKSSSLNIKLIIKRSGYSEGRNIAIQNAHGPIIAITDAGTILEPTWLEYITLPFDINPEIQVVAGWYKPIVKTKFHELLAKLTTISEAKQVWIEEFLPSSRSIAVKKEQLEMIGLYPDWLTSAGEDSLLDIHLKQSCKNWAFAPDAVVWWKLRNTISEVYHQFYVWNRGGGETGYNSLYVQYLYQLYSAWFSFFLVIYLLIALFLGLIFSSPLLSIFLPLFFLPIGLISYTLRNIPPKKIADHLYSKMINWAIQIGTMRGYAQGKRNRTKLFSKRYAKVTNDSVIVISPFSIHDERTDRTLIDRLFFMAKMNIRVIHIITCSSEINKPVWYTFPPDYLEELFYDTLNIKDFINENRTTLKGKYKIVLLERGKKAWKLIKTFTRKMPANAIITTLPSIEQADLSRENQLCYESKILKRSTTVLVQDQIMLRFLHDIIPGSWKGKIESDLNFIPYTQEVIPPMTLKK